ncbi:MULTISPECIES: helix-turn-helix transcriptional regulator [Luteimonas]|uniref:helix-turn-helix transcriptional regulator n=1 Tax=Luteimonas TaxID=83614 RepID=UPI000C7D3796|nr:MULTISPECIES: helix-turn-helix domain-containing protein [Luteimonas]
MTSPLFSETEAAERLNISKATLARERIAGRIRPIRIGTRIIRYTDEIIEEYLQQCRAPAHTDGNADSSARSAQKSRGAPGLTQTVSRSDAHLLALRTFRKGR